MKKLIAALVCYLAVTSALAGGLLGGVLWLIRAEAGSAPVRVAAIPPRIAESIERKKSMQPPETPQAAPAPPKPMHQASVALGQPAKWVIRELTPSAKKRKAPATAPSYAATAARNDNPY